MKTAGKGLESPVEVLPTIGAKRARALADADIHTLENLFYYFPRRYLDRTTTTPIRELQVHQEATVVGRIIQAGVQTGKKNRFVLVLSDESSLLTCIWFSHLRYRQQQFTVGEWLAVSGKVTRYKNLQMIHPEFDVLGDDKEGDGFNTGKIIPVYASTELLSKFGFDSRGFRRIINRLIELFSDMIKETLPEPVRHHYNLLPLPEALRAIHFPADFKELQRARERLKFDELFFLELMPALRRKNLVVTSGNVLQKVGGRVIALYKALPFELTEAQKRVTREIREDLKSGHGMNRLLQGDVGSGKTIVALFGLLIAVENGYQAALMAPTEILAEQHYLTLHEMLDKLGVCPVLLIGGQPNKQREIILQQIADGTAHIIVGTHALIQEGVAFKRLGLVIIDEQHRFGVMQRARLAEKGMNPHILVMTATPIPRSLTLTLYGDLDVSILDELPRGRKPVITAKRSEKDRKKVYTFVRDQVATGAQAYVVFPLVEESEKIDVKAAVESYEIMRDSFFKEFRVGLLHGRLKSEDKESVMAEFKAGDLDVLVSTTVIEVGVDVPNATIMIIEHAERFGLSQLHQLRGRVGRGEKQSYCILIGYGPLSREARERLNVLKATTDGFKIAQKDLELRGPGDYFGTRQSGLPDLRLADVVRDFDLLQNARKAAFGLIDEDPTLEEPSHAGTRSYFLRHYRRNFKLSWIS